MKMGLLRRTLHPGGPNPSVSGIRSGLSPQLFLWCGCEGIDGEEPGGIPPEEPRIGRE